MKFSSFSLLFLLIFSSSLKSQINVSRLNEKDYEAIKQSTTYFVIPEFDNDKQQQYVDLLKTVWNFTNLKVVTAKEAEKIKNDVSISKIIPRAVQVTEGPGVVYLYQYVMYMYYVSRKGELVEKEVAWADFCLKHKAIGELYDKKANQNSQAQYINKNNCLHNYSLGFIKNYLQDINANLSNNKGEAISLSKRIYKEELDKFNAKDTLFIPDYVAEYPETNMEEALAKAKFRYKVIPVKELDAKILNTKTPFYYLNFVRFGYNKGINIVNAKDGSFIFNNWNPMGFKYKNLTLLDDDIKIINGALK